MSCYGPLRKQVASALSLPIQTMYDPNATKPTLMAVCTSRTCHNDLYAVPRGDIRLVNCVAETGTACNGVVCALAPWHGVAIFHGTPMFICGPLMGGC